MMPSKNSTLLDHQTRINQVRQFIEDNLDQPLSLALLAHKAAMSEYHFHRIFRAHAEETLAGFIKRLRLQRAAWQLRYADKKITDLALEAGFDNSSSFGKAFRQLYGQSPREFQQTQGDPGAWLRPEPEVFFLEICMQPKILTWPEQKLLYVRKTGPYAKAAEEAWAALCRFAYPRGLLKGNPMFLGIGHDDPATTEAGKIRYDACITLGMNLEPQGEVGIKTLPAGRYAVFLHQGPYEGFEQTYHQIFSQWLPQSGETLRDAPCLERYLNRDPARTKPENLKTEIMVPLQD